MKSVKDPSDWNDLFVRTSQGETAPTGRIGGLSSPDIIPWGVQPVNPSSFITEDSYRNYVSSQGFLSGQSNYIYVRARNSSPSTEAVGIAYLALTDPAVVLWPGGDKWTFIKTNGGFDGSKLGPVQATGIAVTEDPFVYSPPDSGHRCLVTWLSTKSHPVQGPPPKITDMATLVTFLKDNPNYAHHNIDIAPNTTGASSFPAPMSTGTQPATWMCGLKVRNCKGFTVAFSCATPMPDGTYITFEPTTVRQDEEIRFMLGPFDLAANWNVVFQCTYQTNNLEPTDWSVDFVTECVVNSYNDEALMAFAHPVSDVVGLHQNSLALKNLRAVSTGSLGIMKGSVSA